MNRPAFELPGPKVGLFHWGDSCGQEVIKVYDNFLKFMITFITNRIKKFHFRMKQLNKVTKVDKMKTYVTIK